MINTGNRTRQRASFSVLVLFFTAACARDAAAPTSPTPNSFVPIAIVGKATGRLNGEVPPTRFGVPQARAVSNATLTVIGGAASGTATVTRDGGAYEVTAAGRFKLRFEHPSFMTSESNEMVMADNGVTIPDVVLLTAPWTISGRVIEGQGSPVADADVYLNVEGSLLVIPDIATKTDAAGRYTFSSARPHFESATITPLKPGFETAPVAMKCCGVVPDIRIIPRR